MQGRANDHDDTTKNESSLTTDLLTAKDDNDCSKHAADFVDTDKEACYSWSGVVECFCEGVAGATSQSVICLIEV